MFSTTVDANLFSGVDIIFFSSRICTVGDFVFKYAAIQVSNATLRKWKQRETEAKKRAGNKERKQTERAKKRETKLVIQERKTLKRERQKRWRENKKKLIYLQESILFFFPQQFV
jgi:hypothetical protein